MGYIITVNPIAQNPGMMSISFTGRNLAIDPFGILWAVYTRLIGGFDRIYAAWSNNGGITWNEEEVSVDDNIHDGPVIAIDSQGVIHVAYTARGRAPFPAAYGIFYKQRSLAGVWSAEETVSLQDTGVNAPRCSIAIDSSDDVHCVISTKGYGGNSGVWNIIYRKRTAGMWGPVIQITDQPVVQSMSAIAIDRSNIIHLAWYGLGWGSYPGNSLVAYCKSPLWAPEVVCDENYSEILGSIAVDSLNNPYIAWIESNERKAYYLVKTGGSWSPRERVDEADDTAIYGFGIALDKKDDLHFVYSGFPFGPPWLPRQILYRRKVGGVWEGQINVTADPANTQEYPVILWATWPEIAGMRTNIPTNIERCIWQSDKIYFGSIGIPVPPVPLIISKAYALSREEL